MYLAELNFSSAGKQMQRQKSTKWWRVEIKKINHSIIEAYGRKLDVLYIFTVMKKNNENNKISYTVHIYIKHKYLIFNVFSETFHRAMTHMLFGLV